MGFRANAYHFLSGAAMMGACVCGLYFMRFWKLTGDRFFFFFGLAFWVLAIERIGLVFIDPQIEDRTPAIYLSRMFAFLLILLAIGLKNRRTRPNREVE